MKYLYFELLTVNQEPQEVINENFLFKQPQTDKHGFRTFFNETKKGNRVYIINQIWVDLTKYKFFNGISLDNQIQEALDKLGVCQFSNWNVSKEVPIPRDGKTYLTKNDRSMNLPLLVYWASYDKTFKSHGEDVHPNNSGTHWLPIPK